MLQAYAILGTIITALMVLCVALGIVKGVNFFGVILVSPIASGLILLFFYGFTHHSFPPFWYFLLLWIVCSDMVIDKVEITYNVVIDALLVGFILAVFITLSGSGSVKVITGTINTGLFLKQWAFLSVFTTVFFSAIAILT